MRRYRALRVLRVLRVLTPLLFAASTAATQVQQSDVSFNTSMSLPRASGGTLGGLGLIFAGSSGAALRMSAQVALKNTYGGTPGTGTWLPPWGADADAMFALSGRPFGRGNRTGGSFLFVGIGKSARDTAAVRMIEGNWSYGIGTVLPLGAHVDLLAESRWRMSRFVLPTASPKPPRSKEIRFGMSFHLPGGGANSRR